MKKLYLTLLIIFSFTFCKAQFVTIPDANFVTWLNNNGFASCMSGNKLDTICSAVLNAVTVNCSSASISDLTGIQYFKMLNTLTCYSNNLSTLPTLPSSLTYLSCYDNGLAFLPSLPSFLNYLDCNTNNLTVIPALPPTLAYLDCGANQLTSLPPLPAILGFLNCGSNNLSTLPVLSDSLLDLDCSFNQLTSLPAMPDSLYYLNIQNNSGLSCLQEIKKIYLFIFTYTNIQCVPNYGRVYYSNPSLDSIPLCAKYNPSNCTLNSVETLLENSNQMALFPNPTSGSFTISSSTELNNALIEIDNVLGEKVSSIKTGDTRPKTIDISELASGIYFVRITTPEGTQTVKVVKTN